MALDSDIIAEILSAQNYEALRQALHKLPSMDDKNIAFSTVVEFTRHDNAMIRRNAAIVMGKIKDKRAVGFLIEMICREFQNSKIYTDNEVLSLDYQLIRDCIDAIKFCGYTKNDMMALEPYADKLHWYKRVDESLIGEIADLVGYTQPKETIMEKEVTDLRHTAVKNNDTPPEELRKSLINNGLEDSSVTWNPETNVFKVKNEVETDTASGVKDDIPDGYIVDPSIEDRPLIYTPKPKHTNPPHRSGPPTVFGILIIAAIVTIVMIVIGIAAFTEMTPNSNTVINNAQNVPTPTQVNTFITPTPVQSTYSYCDISGRVITKTGQGIAHATVAVGRFSTVTDDDGYYSISGVLYYPPSSYAWAIVWAPDGNSMLYSTTITINGSTNSMNFVEGTFGN